MLPVLLVATIGLAGCAISDPEPASSSAVAKAPGAPADVDATTAPAQSEVAALSGPVKAQISYALKYWSDRNTAEYGSIGENDCVNFASQSLIARGWIQDDDWFYSNDNGDFSWSNAWSSSTSFNAYMEEHPEKGTALTDQQRDQVKIGDIVQFDWDNSGDRDHTGIVTKVGTVNGVTEIYFAGHSDDSDYRSVDDAITIDHPGGTAYYWSIN